MFVDSINWHSLFNKINTAKSCVYLSLPGIDEELSQHLVDVNRDNNVSIEVCLDNREDTIRNGYGEAAGIDKLIENGIVIRECKGNRVSFIIVDNSGYIFFPESRIFSADPTGPNAIELDGFTISRLLNYFFPPADDHEREVLDERFSNSIQGHKEWMHKVRNEVFNDPPQVVTEEFDKSEYAKTKASLIKNPPIEPDLQRQIKTYTAKILYVELKFTGINLQSRTINIPKDALPINNKELKKLLQTKMKLFQNIERNKDFEIFEELKKKVETLRDDYLTPITCRDGKSLIKVEMKEAFINSLQKIKNEIAELNKQLPDILEAATLETKDLIKAELTNFFKENEPDEVKQYSDAAIKERKLNEFVDRLVYRIPFPKTEKLIENISLSDYYYDLTFQDFSDEKLIEEFRKKKIMQDEDIKGIVEMKHAFEEKK